MVARAGLDDCQVTWVVKILRAVIRKEPRGRELLHRAGGNLRIRSVSPQCETKRAEVTVSWVVPVIVPAVALMVRPTGATPVARP